MVSLTDRIQDIVFSVFPSVSRESWNLDIPPKAGLGDFTIATFLIAKSLKASPMEVAKRLAEAFSWHTEVIASAEAMGGYVNFRLAPSIWLSILSEHKICSKSARNETVIVDYIGLNIGKPSHIGHLCTPTIGQTIINTYRYLGFRVIGDNHLGDWGGIFGKLIAAFKLFGNETDLIANPIEYLLSLYIKVTAEAEKDPSIDQRCRDEFKKLTEADPENMELWKRFTTFTLQAVQPQMDLIGAHADYAIGESYYEWLPLPKIGDHPDLKYSMKEVVEELIQKGVATKNEDGSVGVVFPKETKLPSNMLQKRDGTHGYFASDLTTIKYRMTNGWHPRKIMVCLDSRQKTHIAQVFTAARMTWPDLLEGVELIPVLNGFIKLKDGAMSTRKGTIIRLQDLLDEAFVRTKAIITEKGQALSDDDISAIAIGAVKYSYLAQDRENDVIFDWDKALSFEGNSGPYIQYALVRARNILEKAGNLTGALSTEDFTSYDAACLRRVMFFDRIVQETATKCKPHVLALYLYELASDFNAFYVHTPKILEEKNEALKHARIRLVSLVCETLQKWFDLLAIKVPSKM